MSNGRHGFNAYKLQLAIEGCCFSLQCLHLQCAWCKKSRVKTINSSKFGIRHLKIKTLVVTWCSLLVQFWNNKLDGKMLYHLGFNNEIYKLWSWYATCDGKLQLSLVGPTSRIEMLQLHNNNGQCVRIMRHH
jgi:hypothetical protein